MKEKEQNLNFRQSKRKLNAFFSFCACITFVGAFLVIRSYWKELTLFARLFLTLGISIVAYGMAWYCLQKNKYILFINPLFIIFSVLLPFGLVTLFSEIIGLTYASALSTLVSCLSFSIFLASYFIVKKEVFVFFSIASATWFFYAAITYLFSGTAYAFLPHLREYKFLCVGIGYLFTGLQFSHIKFKTRHVVFTPWLYSIGSFLILLALFFITGSSTHPNTILELIYPFVLIAFFAASMRLKTTVVLIISSFFLFLFILKTGYEYLPHFSLAAALFFSGIALAVCGYIVFNLNSRFSITEKNLEGKAESLKQS